MPGKISLFVPGPTNMPDRVRQAMDISNEDHRAPGMDKFWHPLIADLKNTLFVVGQDLNVLLIECCFLFPVFELPATDMK